MRMTLQTRSDGTHDNDCLASSSSGPTCLLITLPPLHLSYSDCSSETRENEINSPAHSPTVGAAKKVAELQDTVAPPGLSAANGIDRERKLPALSPSANGMGLTAAASITDANLAAVVLQDKLSIKSPTPELGPPLQSPLA